VTGSEGLVAPPVIRVQDLVKVYQAGDLKVTALRHVSLSIGRGEFVAVMGPSGSGKSTFLNVLGCLDRPTSGVYELDGVPVSTLSRDALARIRNDRLGFVFQGFNLLARTPAVENVELPLVYTHVPGRERRARALESLERVGLADRVRHLPHQLSGGQQQRVAIARALVNRPSLLLADEPTGNLDTRNGLEIMALLQRLNRETGLTIVLVTHEPDIATLAGREVVFRDGRVIRDESRTATDAAAQLERLPAQIGEEEAA
jgi:putative ABC transport system ATP-binding protein